MKKLLSFISVATFLSTPISAIVSCGKTNDNSKVDKKFTEIQQQMLEASEFVSRMVIASRHENLNINLNELLSIYFSPTPTSLMIPNSYQYKDKNINLASKIELFKNILSPKLDFLNKDGSAGVYASYIMGMYDNNFYNNFLINGGFEDSFNEDGGKGFNDFINPKNNEMGILSGLDKDLKLSENQEQRNLAWGIQDTGPLTNYLLDKGYDGSYPGDTNGTDGISTFFHGKPTIHNGGTNSSGYLHYNSIVSKGKGVFNGNGIEKDINDKLKNVNYTPAIKKKNQFTSYAKVNDIEFNKLGTELTNIAGNLNIDGYINKITSIIQSISTSDFGTEMLLNLENNLLPVVVSSKGWTNTIIQTIGFSFIYNVQNAINKIQNNSDLSNFLLENNFNTEILNKKINKRNAIVANDAHKPVIDKAQAIRLYKTEKDDVINNQLENLKQVSLFIEELIRFHDNLKNKEKKVEFVKKFLKNKNTPFWDSYEIVIKPNVFGVGAKGLTQLGWEELVGEEGDGFINALNLLAFTYKDLASSEKNQTLTLISNDDDFKNKSLVDLNKTQKNKLKKLLGYNSLDLSFEENSIFNNIFNVFKNKEFRGSTEFSHLFDIMKNSVNEDMNKVHEQSLQYIANDDFWDISNININATDQNQFNGEIEFTLNYKGNGDSESNASKQKYKIDVPENFNPYQTIKEHQKEFLEKDILKNNIDDERISGEVLLKRYKSLTDEDLINYDGKAMNYNPVNFKYKILWKNISNNSEIPYWVITEFKSFDEEGDEFYNIY
ncbi:hypothetical protein [Spiroplasma turonicum]|uniref:Lipoprotein n=1 Tax=Spiroplasma turonicum TaxID=216946 RepID=A0A0K1P5P5_9MOLU|nr:hypothetical protein [Spiroplasma turonicum]AKU79628.1 hypothetical protein STURON_00382 [Spiroplasma turonicum]ALX70649.1 hypothetical protein STURO_v1c03810 [Spiroplasma turonicum]